MLRRKVQRGLKIFASYTGQIRNKHWIVLHQRINSFLQQRRFLSNILPLFKFLFYKYT